MKTITNKIILVILSFTGIAVGGCGSPPPTAAPTEAIATVAPTALPQEVVLTMASWRSDDVEQMNRIFAKFNERYPNISIKYDTGYQPDYDTPLLAQLEDGTGPDLLYLRSLADSHALYERGFLESLDDLHGLEETFSPAMRTPWATVDGIPYGVPFIANSH